MNTINLTNHSTTAPNTSFKGYSPLLGAHLAQDTGKISKKTAKLLASLNDVIEKDWAKIKKEKILGETPIYIFEDKDGVVSIKPIYSQRYPALLIEKSSGNTYHRIIMNRDNPSHFTYEKNIYTDYGSATLKSYNSKIEQNQEINNFVDNMLENSLRNIIPVKTLRYTFSDDEFKSVRGGIVLK